MWGAALCSWLAVADILAGVIDCRVNTGKTDKGAAAGKVTNIADLRHKLRSSCVAHAIHGMNGFVLRQFLRKTSHLAAYNGDQLIHCSQLLGSRPDQQLCIAVFGQCNDMTEAPNVNVSGFGSRKIIPHALAPLLVALFECIFTGRTDTLAMPKGRDKVHPLLMAICSLGTFEQFVDSREHLVGQ